MMLRLSNFSFFIALMFFLVPVCAVSQDSLANEKYERRMQTRDNMWRSLIPDITVLQFAGGTGMFSLGTGWVYGKSDNWETTVNLGFIPRKYNDRPYWVFSVKENYLPWRIALGRTPLEVRPLCVTFGLSSILHGDFWTSEPDRYPKGYYGFSSKIRAHIGVGQRFSLNIPYERRRLGRQISFYYEVSTCELYIRQKIMSGKIPLKDIIILGVGLIYTI